jgi:hypothetical protein
MSVRLSLLDELFGYMTQAAVVVVCGGVVQFLQLYSYCQIVVNYSIICQFQEIGRSRCGTDFVYSFSEKEY